MEWLEPWTAVAGEERQRLSEELQRELPTGHSLHSVPLLVVGRSLATDAIVVQRLDGPPYVVVHLTWQVEGSPLWPAFEQFAGWDDFARQRMAADNYGY